MREILASFCLLVVCFSYINKADGDDKKTESKKQTEALHKKLDATIEEFSGRILKDPKNVGWYSRRGDAYFFRGEFSKAVNDYDKMVEFKPDLENSHWRRGIAWFYAGDFKKAAHQFEIYNSFDDVDRENGIWRFFSQSKAYGKKKAQEGLLKYKKDDREPFPSVYQLFAEKITPDEILKKIEKADISKSDSEKRYFYAHLYIGLNHAVNGNNKLAKKHLKLSVDNKWGPDAGFGPSYMWHVGRLHYEILLKQKSTQAKP